MDFWDITIDEALSGAPISTSLAEETLTHFASAEIDDDLSALSHSQSKIVVDPEEVDASSELISAEREALAKKKNGANGEKSGESSKAVSLDKAYFEVKKFAISGMEGAAKEDANVRLAVSLGAKPKKKKYVNYKELKQERSDAKKAVVDDPSLRVRKGGVKKRKGKDSGKKSKKGLKKSRRR